MRLLARGSAALILFATSVAIAQNAEPPPNPRAEALNEEGKKLYAETKDYGAAAQKFEAAIAIDPSARYYFNLCAAFEKLEQYQRALDACDQVYAKNGRPELQQKAGKRAAAIRQKMKEQPPVHTPPPIDPNNPQNPPPTNPYQPPPTSTGPPPAAEVAAEAPDSYKWALTFGLGPMANVSVGDEDFGRGGFGLRIGADFLISKNAHLGIEPYFQYGVIPGGTRDFNGQRQLSILDIGAGLYWEKRLFSKLYFRPLVGVQLGAMQPYNTSQGESFLTFGTRLEAGFSWLLGGGTHVITVSPLALNIYLPSARQVAGDLTAAAYGFDEAGVTYAFTVSYSVRFKSGILPGLFSLE
jgi:tetratricopeptide (TPR) repeat protein